VGVLPKQLEIEDNRPEANLSDEQVEQLYADALARLRARDEKSPRPEALPVPASRRVN
jgi:hypothetical protein